MLIWGLNLKFIPLETYLWYINIHHTGICPHFALWWTEVNLTASLSRVGGCCLWRASLRAVSVFERSAKQNGRKCSAGKYHIKSDHVGKIAYNYSNLSILVCMWHHGSHDVCLCCHLGRQRCFCVCPSSDMPSLSFSEPIAL